MPSSEPPPPGLGWDHCKPQLGLFPSLDARTPLTYASAMDFGDFGFVRVAAAHPPVRLADPQGNAAEILSAARRAVARGASVALFPELALSAYTCEDLFQSRDLLAGVRKALGEIARE